MLLLLLWRLLCILLHARMLRMPRHTLRDEGRGVRGSRLLIHLPHHQTGTCEQVCGPHLCVCVYVCVYI